MSATPSEQQAVEIAADGSDNTWQSYDIDLSAYDNTQRLRVIFDAEMDAANDMWFIDDIRIVSKP